MEKRKSQDELAFDEYVQKVRAKKLQPEEEINVPKVNMNWPDIKDEPQESTRYVDKIKSLFGGGDIADEASNESGEEERKRFFEFMNGRGR